MLAKIENKKGMKDEQKASRIMSPLDVLERIQIENVIPKLLKKSKIELTETIWKAAETAFIMSDINFNKNKIVTIATTFRNLFWGINEELNTTCQFTNW